MKKYYELKNQRHKQLIKAENALKAGKMEEYTTAMSDIPPMNEEISAYENLLAEQGRFNDDDYEFINKHEAQEKQKEENLLSNQLDLARSGNEYAREWSNALKEGLSPNSVNKIDGFGALKNALSITGGSGEEGGFLVPIDFDNMIHEKRKEFVCLADFFNVEEVNTHSGWRAVETAASRKPLPKLTELGDIPIEVGPTFEKIDYTIVDYGDIIQISNDLLEDNTVGLMRYLAAWFTPRVVLTENALLLKLLETIKVKKLAKGKEIAELKSALNKGLNTAHSKSAVLLANQSAYDVLDQSVDANGRGLLVPNPADPDVYRFKQRPVVKADDDLIPNAADGSLPIYVGDFKSAGTLFRRKALEFATTAIGGSAWRTNSVEVRGIARLDAKAVDKDAALYLQIDPETTTLSAPAMMATAEALAPMEQRLSVEELTQLTELMKPLITETVSKEEQSEEKGKKTDEKDTKAKK